MPEKYVFAEGYCDSESLAPQISIQIGDLTEYKEAHQAFQGIRSGARTPQGGNLGLVAFSNFPPHTVVDLIQKNPTMKFIRVFNGVRKDNSHYMFMVAVDGNEMVLDTIVVENCCQCPPRCIPPQGGF